MLPPMGQVYLTKGGLSRYKIKDAAGELIAVHVRKDTPDGEKRMWWECPNGKPGLNGTKVVDLPLYGSEHVCDWPVDWPVVLVEGERPADALLQAGIKALGTVTGAASEPGHDVLEILRDREVILWPDADKVGRGHMERIARRLQGVAETVRWFDDPDASDGEDAADHPAIVSGGEQERGMLLNDLLCAPEWKLQPEPERNGSGPRTFTAADADHHQTTTTASEFGGGGATRVSLPVKTVEEFFAEAGEETNWVCEGITAKNNVTDIAGEPKQSGKTTFAVHLIKASLNGEPFLDMSTAEVKWLYATEQGSNFREALEGAGLSEQTEGLHILQQKDVRSVLWPDLVRGLARAAVERECDALVIDTFAAFSGIVGTEENNSGDIREKMAVVREVAQEHDLAVIVLRHAGKSGRARGSSQFEADADIVLTLKRVEGSQPETVRVLEGNGRFDIIPRRLQIELTEDKGYVSHGLDSRTQFKKARNTIMRLLPMGEHAAIQQTRLFEKLKAPEHTVSESTARRVLKWLVEHGQVCRKEKPVRFWKPEHDHHQTNLPWGEFGGGDGEVEI